MPTEEADFERYAKEVSELVKTPALPGWDWDEWEPIPAKPMFYWHWRSDGSFHYRIPTATRFHV